MLILILKKLSYRDRVNFIATNIYNNDVKHYLLFNKEVRYDTIKNSSYFDSFTSLLITTNTIMTYPKKIKKIYIECCFKKYIKNITFKFPNTITHLTFGHSFNTKIQNCLPTSLTHLTFGNSFNQDIYGYLPNSLIYLKFGYNFCHDITNCLSNSITHLIFGASFDCNINQLPNSLTHLTISCIYNLTPFLPKTVTHLTLIYALFDDYIILSAIPNHITHLTFINCINWDLIFFHNFIPNSVTHITFLGISRTPWNMGYLFNAHIKDYIPNSVTHITFSNNYNITNIDKNFLQNKNVFLNSI